jgi:uncharacterized protein YggU (UPF0235/DUF167 family)
MATILTVKVQPRSKTPGIEKLGENAFRVRVVAVPEKGRANREVAERLADYLDVAPSRLTLVRGAASSRKLFRLEP